MMFLALLVALSVVSSTLASGWLAGPLENTILGVTHGRKNASQVYAAGYNGHHGFVFYSYDRGNVASGTILPIGDSIAMDITISNDGHNIVVVGANGIWYGAAQGWNTTFQKAANLTNVISQNVQALGTSGFAAIGRFNGTNGVAISQDGGVTWNTISIGADLDDGYFARYGAFPTSNEWYITAGTWPYESDAKLTNGKVARVSGRLSIYYDTGNGTPQTTFMSARHLLGTYPGAIYKTTDGGASFTRVFNSNGQFYLNQIDCYDSNNCYAVGENGKMAVIVATSDGGANWITKMTLKGPYSLHAVKMMSTNEVFIGGGTPSVGPFAYKEWVGYYYHTTDGGNNWTLQEINGYGYDFSFFDDNHGYAASLFKHGSYVWVWTSTTNTTGF